MSALGSLVVSLALEYAQYTAGLGKSEQAALEHAKRVQDTFDGIKGKVMGVAAAIGGGIAAAFTIGAFKSLISDAVASGAALNDMAVQTGATVEGLSELAEVGKYSDVTLDDLGRNMNGLTKRLSEIKDESQPAAAALAELGLNLDDFRNLKPEEQMKEIARALDGFQDGAGKSAVMMALFGEQGAKMVPFMKDLAGASELQARVTAEQAAAADQLDDNWKKLTITGGETAEEVAMGMVPAFDEAVRAAMDVMSGAGGIREVLRGLVADGSVERWTRNAVVGLSYVVDVAEYIWRQFELVGKAAGGVLAGVMLAVQGDFKGAIDALSASGQDMVDTFTAPTLGQRFRESMDKVRDSAGDTAAELDKPKLAFVAMSNASKKAADEAEKAAKRGVELATSLTAQDAGLSGDFLKKWDDLGMAYRKGAIDLDTLVAAQARLLEQQPFITKHAEELARIRERTAAMQDQQYSAMASGIDQLMQQNAALEDEIELIGLDERSRRALAEAKNQQLILDKELELQMARNIEGNEQTVAVLERELNLLNRRQELLGRRNDFADWADDSAKRAKALEDVLVNGWQRSGDAFADFVVDGKNGFGDLVTSVIKDLIKMEYQAQMTSIWKSIGGFSGIWGGLTTGLANMMGGNSLDNLINLTGGWGTVAVNHGGGIAGLEAAGTRSVSMTAFATAPRFHTGGIAGDEVPIIARKGEGIFTEQQMRNLAPVDRESSRSVVVHLTNQFNGPADKAQVMTAAHLGAAMAERNIRDQLNRGRM